MCGIVGVVGNIFKKEEEIFEDLLRVDILRGPDSTGVAVLRGNKQVAWAKDIVYPNELIEDKVYKSLFWGKITAVVGHNRWATRGRVTPQNAHPFNIGKITGVHNGTLTGQHHLIDHKKFVVDSENIMHSLDKEGVDATIGNLQGAYCLVWLNSEDNTINFIRNKERPLFLTLSEDQNTLFYASEAWMLSGVLGRHGKKHGDIWPLPEDTLFTYKLDGVKVPMDKPHCRKLEGRPPPPPVNPHPDVPPRHSYYKRFFGGDYSPKSQRVLDFPPNVGGMAWRKGDLIEFKVLTVGKTSMVSPVFKLIGTSLRGGGQHILVYVREDHYLLDKLKEGVGDVFMGHISSVWFDQGSRLNVLLSPETLSARQHTASVEAAVTEEKEDVLIVDRDGNVIPEVEFEKLTKQGCAWCSDRVQSHQSQGLVWLDCDEFICGDCAETTQVKDYLNTVNQYY